MKPRRPPPTPSVRHPPRIDREFDTTLANELARLESYNKHLYRPNTYLHKWWARRCGSTFRLILKHLVDDESAQDYYRPGGLEGRVILDPMMGGGTTLHEAIRMGANVIGADIDPIPVLQARASLSRLSLPRLERAFTDFYRELERALGPYYQTRCPQCDGAAQLRFLLYGQLRACACGPAVVVDSLVLRQEAAGSLRLCPACYDVVRDDHECPGGVEQPRLVQRPAGQCPTCGQEYCEDHGRPYFQRYTPVAVFGYCPAHPLFVARPGLADRQALARADAQRASLPLPSADFAIAPGPKSDDLLRRRITSYLDLFGSRQLLYLHHALEWLRHNAAEPLIGLNLALLVSTSLEFNSLLCGFKGTTRRRAGAIRHTFSLHAYSFPYTALENNPLFVGRASGTLPTLFHARIRRARQWAARPVERRLRHGRAELVEITGEMDQGEEVWRPEELARGRRRFLLLQGSSARLALEDGSVDYVVTDPPYFDSVQYGDLATFFRIWMRQMAPTGLDWEYGLKQAAVRSRRNGTDQYTEVLRAIFQECRRVLRPEHGRLIFTFHHWNPQGWAALNLALRRAGFQLLNRYVVHAENPISVHIAGMKALTHDAILVLAQGTINQPAWVRPANTDKQDSKRFCFDCGTMLGWALASGPPENELAGLWADFLA